MALAAGQERHPHALVRHFLDRLDAQSQGLAHAARLGDRAHRDADVGDLADHEPSPSRVTPVKTRSATV